jgi:hypothetical protein
MNGKPKGPQAARLRQRKLELLRRFQIPGDLLPVGGHIEVRRIVGSDAVSGNNSRRTVDKPEVSV